MLLVVQTVGQRESERKSDNCCQTFLSDTSNDVRTLDVAKALPMPSFLLL